MADITEGEETLLPNGLRSWATDISTRVGQLLGHIFAQVVDIVDSPDRELGEVTITGQPLTATITGQPISVTGTTTITEQPIEVDGTVTVEQDDHDSLNANVNLQVGEVDVGPANPVDVVDTFEIITRSDIDANENSKVFTMGAGYIYYILWIWVEYTSDATVGNRQLQIDFRDAADDIIGQIRPGVVQAASLTYNYMIGPSLADHLGVRDADYIMTPMPPTVFLQAEYDIRIWDNNNVSGGWPADDMVVKIQLGRRAV